MCFFFLVFTVCRYLYDKLIKAEGRVFTAFGSVRLGHSRLEMAILIS